MSAEAHVGVYAEYPILLFDSKGNLHVPKIVVNFMKTHRAIKCVMVCDRHRFKLAINLWTWILVSVTRQLMTFYKSQDYVMKQTRA